jgi:type I restriction enzyme S subunit
MSNVSSSNSQGELVPELRFPEFSGEWKKKYVENFCKIQTGSGNTQDKESEGTYPFFVRSPVVEHSNKYIFDCEAVLTVGDGVGTGKVYHYINGKFNCHQRVYAMTNFEKSVCARYFFYHFQKIFPRQVFAMSAKTSVDSIRRNMIAQLNMALPSINEQKKITQFFTLIDSRIEKQNQLVNVLKSYKRGLLARLFPKKGDTVPELRFKEFTADWERRKLSDICERVTRKNKNSESDLPLTISSQYGLIDQRDFFNKVVAAKDMSNYYLLQNGEYAYNKSYSNGYDYGSIKRLNAYEQGCLSTLYICFSLESSDVNSDYLECFFDTLQWYGDVSMICAEGARNHGLLNVDTKAFFTDVRINMPINIEEQRQISQYSNTLDTLIALHQEKCEMYAKIKNVLFKKMFI